MSNIFNTLDSLESTSSTKDKISIVKNGLTPELKELLNLALSFRRKFFIKKFDDYCEIPDGKGATHKEFLALAEKLEKRQITGDAARTAVDDFFLQCTKPQRKWYGRVLRKDLRCGVDVDLANKAGADIPLFEVMLAKDAKKSKGLETFMAQGGFISPKLDGYRCLAVIDNGDVQLFSRNGKEYENFPLIKAELSRVFHDQKIVLDGEIMSDNFQSMQKTAFSSKSKQTVGDVKYFVFDVIPFMEWASQVFEMRRRHRVLFLDTLELDKNSKLLVTVPQQYIDTLAAALKIEQDFISQGYEGAMFAPAEQVYYTGRKTGGLVKFKTFVSQDCKVIGFIEGQGKHSGKLGSLLVTQENGETCEVGTGFSDEDREYVWAHQSEICGRFIEVKYQNLSDDGIMRFPVFVRYREDK